VLLSAEKMTVDAQPSGFWRNQRESSELILNHRQHAPDMLTTTKINLGTSR
jgi:hypothetical protein